MDRHQPESNVGWDAWGNHVLTTLEKLENKVDKLEERINKQREETVIELATLKAKAGVWGSIAGVIASFITSLIVGLLVYNLTHGTVQKNVPLTPSSPAAATKVIPTREDPLACYNLKGGNQV